MIIAGRKQKIDSMMDKEVKEDMKQRETMAEHFSRLIVDISVDFLNVSIKFEHQNDAVSIDLKVLNLEIDINKSEPYCILHPNKDDSVKIDSFFSMKDCIFAFGKSTLVITDINIEYIYSRNHFKGKLGYLKVDSDQGRALQIGLDDPEMRNKLDYQAIKVRADFDENDDFVAINLNIKHSSISLYTEMITTNLKLIEIINSALYIVKIKVFQKMMDMFNLMEYENDMEDTNSNRSFKKDSDNWVASLLEKIELAQITENSKQSKKDLHASQKGQLKITLRCQSILVLLQFGSNHELPEVLLF